MYIEKDENSLKMYISSIEARDAGQYTCRGTIEGNRMERTTKLLLFSKSLNPCATPIGI